MTRVLAISPHLDDAVFSAGGTLAHLAASGAEVTIATVFTATVPDPQGFALACQLDKGLTPDVDYMALRREEDRAACAILGAAALHLPFREAPHRGYDSAPALFAGFRPNDGIGRQVTATLSELVRETRPDLILAPQAVGAHVDHMIVVEAVSSLPLERGILWWRDHPYAIRPGTPAEPMRAYFADCAPKQVDVAPPSWELKIEAALAYESQLGFQFGGREEAERIFRLQDPAELFLLRASASDLKAGEPVLRLLKTSAAQ